MSLGTPSPRLVLNLTLSSESAAAAFSTWLAAQLSTLGIMPTEQITGDVPVVIGDPDVDAFWDLRFFSTDERNAAQAMIEAAIHTDPVFTATCSLSVRSVLDAQLVREGADGTGIGYQLVAIGHTLTVGNATTLEVAAIVTARASEYIE